MALYDERQVLERVSADTVDNKKAVRVVIAASENDTSPILGGNDSIAIADETISAVKCLIVIPVNKVGIAKPDTLANSTVIGISKTSGATGSQIRYQYSGEFFDSSLSFTEGTLLYLGASGQITDTPPISGFQTKIGTAITNGININIEQPIEL